MSRTPVLREHPYYVGLIPGFNSTIDPDNRYAKRLLSKVVVVDLKPVAMVADVSVITKALESENSFAELKKFLRKKPVWNEFNDYIKLHNEYIKSWGEGNYNGIRLLATVDSAVNNSYNHSYSTDFFDSATQGVLQALLGSMSGKIRAVTEAITTGLKITKNVNIIGKMFSGNQYNPESWDNSLAVLSNHRVSMPRTWDGTSTSDVLALNIKLTSPSGEPEAIQKYIIDPIILLFLMSAPISFTGVDFSMPFTYEIDAKGLVKHDFAAITNVSLDRGGPDVIFNRYQQPLEVSVRFTIVPLSTDVAAGIDRSAVQSYQDTWFTTPKKIYDSLLGDTNNKGTT